MCPHLQKMFSLETKIHKTLRSTLYMHIFNHSDQCKAPHQCRCLEISLVINGSSNRVVLWQYQYIHHAALCMIVSSFTITRLIDPKFAKNLVCIMIRVFSVMTVKELSLAFFFPECKFAQYMWGGDQKKAEWLLQELLCLQHALCACVFCGDVMFPEVLCTCWNSAKLHLLFGIFWMYHTTFFHSSLMFFQGIFNLITI